MALKQPEGPLYLGNAGTAMRLMAGLMAAQSFDVTLTGDHSLSGRPMSRVVDPLSQMGAIIEDVRGWSSTTQDQGRCTVERY